MKSSFPPAFLRSLCAPAGRAQLGVLIFLAALLAACGGHKAQVRTPGRQAPAAQAPASPPPGRIPSTPSIAPSASPEARPVPPPATSRSGPPQPVPSPAAPFSPSVAGPPIRIGIYTSAVEIRISSSAGFYLVEKIPESPRHAVSGEIQVRLEREGQAQEVYRIQVAALSRSDAADALRAELTEKFGIPVVVRDSGTGQSRQVRVGEFETREEAQGFLATVRESGYPDAIVIRDFSGRGTGEAALALRGPDQLFRVSSSGFLFYPSAPTAFLRLDGKPYRGIFDVALNRSGRITVVNQLGTEEYLLGVVPSELSPTRFPAFAALAAQSVAARTYALKNLGRFRADGFDLTADVRTQVYGGVSAEREASSAAVEKTAGLSLYYAGNLIDAMYTSTCGGRTEDFSNVFDSPPVPYLSSVVCAVENNGGPSVTDVRIAGRNGLALVFVGDDGAVANRDIELAAVLGIPGSQALTPDYLNGSVEADEAREWIGRARKAAALSNSPPFAGDGVDLQSRAGFLRAGVDYFFGPAEIERRISQADADYFIANLKDGGDVPAAARRPLAYLIQAQLWRPYPDNSVRASERLRRADALSWLARWVESVRPELLRSGTFSSAASAEEDDVTRIVVKGSAKSYETTLARDLRLFRMSAGRSMPVEGLTVIGNERMRYHVNAAGAADFLEIELNGTGAASDRFSPVATWQTALSRPAVAEKLRGLAENIGEFRDLKPARLGNSGRVVQILIVGSRGAVQVNGYKFRNALGLKDTLFTISREVNPEGAVERFVFNGRGWGHGIGMCQVGAFGMARAGRTFEEILKTYYQGVEIRKSY